eukprot:528555-Hanusia_phi.AAC.2
MSTVDSELKTFNWFPDPAVGWTLLLEDLSSRSRVSLASPSSPPSNRRSAGCKVTSAARHEINRLTVSGCVSLYAP